MSNPYVPVTGTRRDITAVDPAVKEALNPVNFTLSTSAGTYSPEQYTTSYIGSIFKAMTQIEDSWNSCKQTAVNYINDFEDVPLTEKMPQGSEDIIFEEESVSESASNTSATLAAGVIGTGVVNTAMLNIRKESNANSQILGTYKMDDNIEIRGYDGNWIEVRLPDGTKGYISRNFVTENNQTVNQSSQPKETNGIKLSTEPVETLEESVEEPVRDVSSVSGKVSTNGSNLRIRDEKGNIIGSLSNNSDINITGKIKINNGQDEEEWYEIDLGNGQVGRVSAKWVDTNKDSIPDLTPSPVKSTASTPKTYVASPSNPMKGTVETITGSLRVRRGPSLEDEIVGYLPRNGNVDILEYSTDENEHWAKILYNGEEMYVYKSLIDMR